MKALLDVGSWQSVSRSGWQVPVIMFRPSKKPVARQSGLPDEELGVLSAIPPED